MDIHQSAKQVMAAVGGKDNLDSVAHCATRLRLTLKDESKLDMDAVKAADGVKGAFQVSGQLQVVYGLGVDKVADAFNSL